MHHHHDSTECRHQVSAATKERLIRELGRILPTMAILRLCHELDRPLINALDRAILTVFIVDITLRLYAQRAAFWRNPCVVGSCQHF